jgi:hypothetical protein
MNGADDHSGIHTELKVGHIAAPLRSRLLIPNAIRVAMISRQKFWNTLGYPKPDNGFKTPMILSEQSNTLTGSLGHGESLAQV